MKLANASEVGTLLDATQYAGLVAQS
jgi:hypothetical protein